MSSEDKNEELVEELDNEDSEVEDKGSEHSPEIDDEKVIMYGTEKISNLIGMMS